MKIKLQQRVALAKDLSQYNLHSGNVAVVVEHLPATPATQGEEGYALEVFNAVGDTIAVIMVPASAVEPLTEDEILQVRLLNRTKRKITAAQFVPTPGGGRIRDGCDFGVLPPKEISSRRPFSTAWM